jgi:hypothetical protein
MSKRIGYFGGRTHGHILLEDASREEVWFNRELWFDRDIDGRWLVGVTDPPTSAEANTGAIVVRNQTVAVFIELLGKLVIEPENFADEPALSRSA